MFLHMITSVVVVDLKIRICGGYSLFFGQEYHCGAVRIHFSYLDDRRGDMISPSLDTCDVYYSHNGIAKRNWHRTRVLLNWPKRVAFRSESLPQPP
jgi:hypothetical protein